MRELSERPSFEGRTSRLTAETGRGDGEDSAGLSLRRTSRQGPRVGVEQLDPAEHERSDARLSPA